MALVREGADVVINGRDEGRLCDAWEEIADAGPGTVIAQPGDLPDMEDIAALVDRPVREFGGRDHLVTSAGGPPSGRFLDTHDEDWYQTFDFLMMSVVPLVREATPHLKAGRRRRDREHHIGKRQEAMPSIVLSNAVRRSVLGLERTISKEFAPDVRANVVLPSSIEPDRVRSFIGDAVDRGEYGF